MKLEFLLKIYWSRGLYYNGKLNKYNWFIINFFNQLSGLSNFTKLNFIKRFEYTYFYKNPSKRYLNMSEFNAQKRKIFNSYISRITNTNTSIFELIKLNTIRLYLIKSFRGRAQALGKPSRGQRTWSNAWTAFKRNTALKMFVKNLIRLKKLKMKKKKKNWKIIEKKIRKQAFKIKPIKIIKKKNLWF